MAVLAAATALSLSSCTELAEELGLDEQDVRDLQDAQDALTDAAEQAARERQASDGRSDSEIAFDEWNDLDGGFTYVGPADTSYPTRPPIPLEYGGVQTEGWQARGQPEAAGDEGFIQSETWEFDDPLAYEALESTLTAEYGPPDNTSSDPQSANWGTGSDDATYVRITREGGSVTLTYFASAPASGG